MTKIDLSQIQQDGAANGQVIAYNQPLGKWVPTTPSSGIVSLAPGLPSLQPLLINTGVRHVSSYWRRYTNASGSYGSMTGGPQAVPVNRKGANVIGALVQVQGGVTGTNYVEVGVYDSLDNGLPGALLRQATLTVTTNAGRVSIPFATPIPSTQGTDKLWLAYMVRVMASSSIQLVNSDTTGLGAQELGMNELDWVTSTAQSAFIFTNTTPTGTDGSRVWPATFGTPFAGGANGFPHLALLIQKPI